MGQDPSAGVWLVAKESEISIALCSKWLGRDLYLSGHCVTMVHYVS